MHSKLLDRLVLSSRVVFILGTLLLVFLCIFAPRTSVISDRQGELAQIDAMTDLATLKTHAELLAMFANSATNISTVLLAASILTMGLCVVLSILNLIWLKKLQALRPVDRPS